MAPLVAALYTLASLSNLVLFAWDKRAAERGQRRVRESTLHALELIGGWPGSLLAMRLFRHKSSKRRYRLITASIVLTHALAWGLVIWYS